jgi:hypothetical protein
MNSRVNAISVFRELPFFTDESAPRKKYGPLTVHELFPILTETFL